MNGQAGPGEFQHLYGKLHAAAIHEGMSPACSKLGLGVLEIGIAAGTGADVMAGCAGAAGPAPNVRLGYPELYLYVCKHSQNLGYPNIIWDIPVLMTYPDISRAIPKLNKNRWDIQG